MVSVHMTKRYGPQRVEAACTLALELGAGQYRHVRDILRNGRDLIERAEPAPEWVTPEHDNLSRCLVPPLTTGPS